MPKKLSNDQKARIGAMNARNRRTVLPLLVVGLTLISLVRLFAEPGSTTQHALIALLAVWVVAIILLVPRGYREYEAIRKDTPLDAGDSAD